MPVKAFTRINHLVCGEGMTGFQIHLDYAVINNAGEPIGGGMRGLIVDCGYNDDRVAIRGKIVSAVRADLVEPTAGVVNLDVAAVVDLALLEG